ncbi:leucine zipper domain-containing protein [Streptomyces sp. SPB162]|uniref:leucine zipper domain-containing protein n=1 Tax=Streptomyces sp. SPB162 TaxID=2940560 RepID=UPI00240767C9|nr:leucine zipper domain-containing protein [Streptomyces sp. SPB162]
MPHRDAPLTETGRLRLARCVVDDGWTLRRAAERFQVSPTTAQRWAGRRGPGGTFTTPLRAARPPRSAAGSAACAPAPAPRTPASACRAPVPRRRRGSRPGRRPHGRSPSRAWRSPSSCPAP